MPNQAQATLARTRSSANASNTEEVLPSRGASSPLPLSHQSPASRLPTKKRSSRAYTTIQVPGADVLEYDGEDEEEPQTDDLDQDYDQYPVSQGERQRTTDDFLQLSSQPSLRERLEAGWQSLQSAGSHIWFWAKASAVVAIVGCVTYAGISAYFWVGDQWNTYHYGPTRVYHTTAPLGIDHDSSATPSDILVMNVRGTILVTVVPAGDADKAVTYNTGYHLVGDGVSKTPVTLTVQDVNGDKRPDLVVHIDGQSQDEVLLNQGERFVVSK